ncbi:MAG TPA: tetratricopeptide repeat protein [Myxococcaceae bacterium]|jgi:tetratricopeptide (TPR) repeat protein
MPPPSKPPAPQVQDLGQTIQADAYSPGDTDDADALVEAHRRTALRLLREGAAHKAFAELVKATRSVPMTRRLASALVMVSLQAGTEPACITLLTAGVEDNEGATRTEVRRHLARLLRRVGAVDRAREQMIYLLAEKPGDRRARRALNSLLLQEERWEELDASLEKEVKEDLKRNATGAAARASLNRARLWGERMKDHGRAAIRFSQAAQFFQQLGDHEAAFNLRMLWVRALRESAAPAATLKEAVQQCMATAEKVRKMSRARTLVQELGLAVLDKVTAAAAPALPPVPVSARKATQTELLAAADESDALGIRPETAALRAAAINEIPDPALEQRMEAHYVARGAWRELSQFYRDRAARLTDPRRKVELLTRLAELLEDELKDPTSAARTYGEIVELTGDKQALQEQVRLLSMVESVSGVRKVLDDAVERAGDDQAKVIALVARGDVHLHRRELEAARADFEAAARIMPGHLVALMGLAEARLQLGDTPPISTLRAQLQAVPKRSAGRLDLLRRFGRLAEHHSSDPSATAWAWAEVLAESPADPEAQKRVAALARRTNNVLLLEQALRAQLARDPRGHRGRQARMELVALLERAGRVEEAMGELRQAVRLDPGYAEAWLKLVDGNQARGQFIEAALALEQAATASADPADRMRLWERLAALCREKLNDATRANVFQARADKLRAEVASGNAPSDPRGRRPPPSPPLAAEGERPPAAATLRTTRPPLDANPGGPTPTAPLRQSQPSIDDPAAAAPTPVQPLRQSRPPLDRVATAPATPLTALPEDMPEPSEQTTGKMTPGMFGDLGEPVGSAAPEDLPDSVMFHAAAVGAGAPSAAPDGQPADERTRLFEQVRKNPLDGEGYRALSAFFAKLGDADRSELMRELASALAGATDDAMVPAPKLLLSATDRAALRHPILRNEQGELFSLVGYALCRLFPTRGRAAGSEQEFSPDAGTGGPGTAEALMASVRILGLRAPEVFLSEDNGPPFSLVFPRAPRLLVGQMAIRSRLSTAELRFFAGRALFTQNPDLAALRSLSSEQLDLALDALEGVLHGGKALRAEAKVLRETIPVKLVARLRDLFDRNVHQLDVQRLAEGARHASNRAGLVVCGSVVPAILALRAKKALETEVAELVRFAASERYLDFRTRKLSERGS